MVKLRLFFGKRFSGHKSGISGLDLLVLSMIQNNPGVSGYELVQEINTKFKPLWTASPGTIYPLLNRLTEKAFVDVQEITDENNRQKKIYTLTEAGKEKLKEVLKDNFEMSMNTLGDFIRTIVQTWVPDEKSIKETMSCFPFHCSPHSSRIDENDYSLHNLGRLKRQIRDLEFSKERLSRRLKEIETRLDHYRDVLAKLEEGRDNHMKPVRWAVDDNDFNKDYTVDNDPDDSDDPEQ